MNKGQTKSVLRKLAAEKGWNFLSKGSPDFFGFKDDDFICVYVKPHRNIPLRKEQILVADALTKRGVKIYKFTSDKNELESWSKIAEEDKWARTRITNMKIVNEKKKIERIEARRIARQQKATDSSESKS